MTIKITRNIIKRTGRAGVSVPAFSNAEIDENDISDTVGPGIEVRLPPHDPIPAELLIELMRIVEAGTPVENMDRGLLARFAAFNVNILDWVGRGLTLAQIYAGLSRGA